MNWRAVRRHNAGQTARKARREQLEAERKARVERAGGPITASEIRSATYRVEPPAPGYVQQRHVWTFRDQDWVLGYSDGECIQAMCPYRSYRQDPDTRDAVPLTPGAKKWFQQRLVEMFPEPAI